MNKDHKSFLKDHLIKSHQLAGLIEQLNTLLFVLMEEKQSIESQKKSAKTEVINEGNKAIVSTPFINTTHEVALKTSILIFHFSVLEALVNYLAEITLDALDSDLFEFQQPLEASEINFLREMEVFYDSNNNKTRQRKYFVRLEEKLQSYPYLLGKLTGLQVKINKGEGHWEKFKAIKKKRDQLTHPREGNVFISDEDIFHASGFIYWIYEFIYSTLKNSLFPGNHEPYRIIEVSTSRLVNHSYHATLKQFSVKPYETMQKAFRKKS